jgi:hypothetical protein
LFLAGACVSGLSELDVEAAEWRIPAARRKLRQAAKLESSQPHIVPLSRQVLEVLTELRQLTGRGRMMQAWSDYLDALPVLSGPPD